MVCDSIEYNSYAILNLKEEKKTKMNEKKKETCYSRVKKKLDLMNEMDIYLYTTLKLKSQNWAIDNEILERR